LKINKKVRSVARRSALSIKVANDTFKVLDDLKMNEIKTKNFIETLDKLQLSDKKIIIVSNEYCENLYLSSRNLEKVNLVNVKSFSTYDIMNSNYLVIDKDSVEYLNKNLA